VHQLSNDLDFRDMFMVEILEDLKVKIEPGMMSYSELLVGFVIGISAACIVVFKSNRWGFFANSMTMVAGFVVIGSVALSVNNMSAFLFLVMTGIGVNLIFVPMEAGFFERLIAFLRMDGASASFPVQITGLSFSTFNFLRNCRLHGRNHDIYTPAKVESPSRGILQALFHGQCYRRNANDGAIEHIFDGHQASTAAKEENVGGDC
jgi:hypothetical protein